MTHHGSALRHDAFVYDAEDEHVAVSVAFLREGLEAGQAGVVAHTRSGLARVRDGLGADASAVTFVDVGSAYTRPARTLAAYHAVYADVLRRAPSLRAVADVQFGPDPGEWGVWTGYEAVFNRSLAHLPAWVLCTYSTRSLPEPVREGVWRTHPQVLAGSTWQSSPAFTDPEDVLREVGPPPRPLPGLRTMAVGDTVEEFREHLAREMATDGVPSVKVLDGLVAASEVFVNALQHGGVAHVRVGRVRGRFVCEVVDLGPGFDDPTAGYLAPRHGVGAGLWVARQLTWDIEFFRAPDGFTVRVWL